MRTLIIIFSCAVMVAGCTGPAGQSPQALSDECDRLYEHYVSGGLDEARESLLEVIRLHESAEIREEAKAHGLWLSFGRLFALETRSGNREAAQVALVKARYWCLLKAEFTGSSATEALAYVERFASPEGLLAFVDDWDRNHTDGRGPRYIRSP